MASKPQGRQKRSLLAFAASLTTDDHGRQIARWLSTLPDEKLYEFIAYFDRALELLDSIMDTEKYLEGGGRDTLYTMVEIYIKDGMEQDLLLPLAPEELAEVMPEDGPQVKVENGLRIVYCRDIALIIPLASFYQDEESDGQEPEEG